MSKEEKVKGINIVIIAGYQAIEPAEKNFDQLTLLAKDKKIKTEGMILVQQDLEGKVTVNQTGDHLGRKGMGWGGGVGLLVGLAAPPRLASVVVGAAAGGVISKFTKRKMKSGIEKGLGDKLKPGTAAIITIIEEKDKLAAEQALTDSPAK